MIPCFADAGGGVCLTCTGGGAGAFVVAGFGAPRASSSRKRWARETAAEVEVFCVAGAEAALPSAGRGTKPVREEPLPFAGPAVPDSDVDDDESVEVFTEYERTRTTSAAAKATDSRVRNTERKEI